MTAAPGSIKKIVPIPFSHPRSKSSGEVSSFTAELHELIKSEVEKVVKNQLDEDWQPETTAPVSQEQFGTGI